MQKTIQELITPLIRALGPNHGKLLTLLRTFPSGADTLALRVLTIFTEERRPSAQLVALVKGLISERDLDPRFLIPIIAEMDKVRFLPLPPFLLSRLSLHKREMSDIIIACIDGSGLRFSLLQPDILRHLPRIVSILNGQAEPKALVRSVFSSIVTTPPQTFGSVSSNLPRVRQSELLTPAELMVLLHQSETEIGLKAAMEGNLVSHSHTFPRPHTVVFPTQSPDHPSSPSFPQFRDEMLTQLIFVSNRYLFLHDRYLPVRDPRCRHEPACG